MTREGTFATLQYLRRLSDLGIKFKSYTEQYVDSLGVFGEAIIGILAAVEQERIRISERTKAGLERVRKKGKRLGRPHLKDLEGWAEAEIRDYDLEWTAPWGITSAHYYVTVRGGRGTQGGVDRI